MSSVDDLADFFDHADLFQIGEWTVLQVEWGVLGLMVGVFTI